MAGLFSCSILINLVNAGSGYAGLEDTVRPFGWTGEKERVPLNLRYRLRAKGWRRRTPAPDGASPPNSLKSGLEHTRLAVSAANPSFSSSKLHFGFPDS